MAIRISLIGEVVRMAYDTVRGNRLRSGLTVLGVVIGITSIVGMTSMIRGFDESLRDAIKAFGPNIIMIQRFGPLSFTSGAEFSTLMKRPNLTVSDAKAIEDQAPSIRLVDIQLGLGGGPPNQDRVFYRSLRTKLVVVAGTTENFAEGTQLNLVAGRFFTGTEVQHRSNVVVLGQNPYQALFGESGTDPIGKVVRVGAERYTVVGIFDKRPGVGSFTSQQDDFAVIPYTMYQQQYGLRGFTFGRGGRMGGRFGGALVPIQIAALPRDGVPLEMAVADVERIMRARHSLRLNDPNDFDIATQDSILGLWDQISQATFLALIVISSIALMVGGIGVMAIMSISVTERTREIGVRKALGARRSEILFQFLIEAAFLTSLGGVLGVVLGAAIGGLVHLATGFPISLPWWSFAIGLGFSAGVGIFFGMYPAVKASRLDPIDALRHE
jgi:putative ABC transport system permease protein